MIERLPSRLQRRTGATSTGALAAMALCTMGGCLNESNTIVGTDNPPLPDLATPAPSPRDDPAGTVRTTSLDRSNWPAVTLEQPRDQVAWSFFGSADPAWAVARGPGELPPPPPPTFGNGTTKGANP